MSSPVAALALAIVVLSPVASASASPSYSATMERQLGLECEPSCSVCHTRESGGFATANTRLGINLRKQFRAECCDDDSLESILLQLEAASLDSDGDGEPDVAELQSGSDPNDPIAGAVLSCRKPADSGCAVGSTGSAATLGAGLLVAASLMITRLRRRPAR